MIVFWISGTHSRVTGLAASIWMYEKVKVHLQSPHPSPLPGGGEGVDVALPAHLSIAAMNIG
jgi:hypothetical protein